MMVEKISTTSTIRGLAAQEEIVNTWMQKLIEAQVFENNEPQTWIVTQDNYSQVLCECNILGSHFVQALTKILAANEEAQLSFTEFCQLYQREQLKAATFELRAMDDTDLLETPAQKIISLLREIQNQYIATNQEPTIVDRINYAIEKIG